MSNLNVNNLDVQRIINVLKELSTKIEICSFLTFKTMYNLENQKEKIKEKISNPELWVDLEHHLDCMNKFRNSVIEINEKKEEKNSEIREEEKTEDLDELQTKGEEEKTQRRDLLNIDEEYNEDCKALAKSTRNICRKYYKELQIISEMEPFRQDQKIIDFSKNLSNVLLSHYINKTKMTREEELSQSKINVELNEKISKLDDQIRTKRERHENKKREYLKSKKEYEKHIKNIKDEIDSLREKTKNELDKLAENINIELNNDKDRCDKETEKLKSRLFEIKGKKLDENSEREWLGKYNAAESDLGMMVAQYDDEMTKNRADRITFQNEINLETLNLNSLIVEEEKARLKNITYQEAFLKFEENIKKQKYQNDMKLYASEYIAAHFKGFIARKINKKKFQKVVAPLKKPPLVIADPNAKPTSNRR
jgi:hypothetical protein